MPTIGWFSPVYAPPFVFRKHHGHLGHVVFLPLVGLRGVAIRFGFEDRNQRTMFDQIAAAFDVCRDAVTAALEEQQRTNLAFQAEVRELLKKKDDEIAELKGFQLCDFLILLFEKLSDFILKRQCVP